MLTYYSVVLGYFVNIDLFWCIYHNTYRRVCYTNIAKDVKDLGIGMTAGLVIVASIELICSIGSVVLSCRAYSKCCNTCNMNDCCTCLGCCECDSLPSNTTQVINSFFSSLLCVFCKPHRTSEQGYRAWGLSGLSPLVFFILEARAPKVFQTNKRT